MESMFMVVIFIQQHLAKSYSKLASNTITIERSLENNFALESKFLNQGTLSAWFTMILQSFNKSF